MSSIGVIGRSTSIGFAASLVIDMASSLALDTRWSRTGGRGFRKTNEPAPRSGLAKVGGLSGGGRSREHEAQASVSTQHLLALRAHMAGPNPGGASLLTRLRVQRADADVLEVGATADVHQQDE